MPTFTETKTEFPQTTTYKPYQALQFLQIDSLLSVVSETSALSSLPLLHLSLPQVRQCVGRAARVSARGFFSHHTHRMWLEAA